MSTIGKFFADHWKKLLGGGIAVAGAFIPALAPLIPLGTLLVGTDFQVGSQVGTRLGAGAKKVISHKDIAALSADELAALADAARLLKEQAPPAP